MRRPPRSRCRTNEDGDERPAAWPNKCASARKERKKEKKVVKRIERRTPMRRKIRVVRLDVDLTMGLSYT